MRWTLVSISLLLALPVVAQDPYAVGSCETPGAETLLEVGNVRARLLNNGGLFWKGIPNIYEVPAGSGVQVSHAANLWIGGQIDGEVRISASTYGPYEQWAGPIPEGGHPPTECDLFDRFWHLDSTTERRHAVFGSGPSLNALEWPAHLGAPFEDRNGVEGYQPHDGDVPVGLGDRTAWWIMNDRGNEHTRTRSRPLGVEVHATAFGFDVPGDLGNATFYRYRIWNRGPRPIDSMGVSMWADLELGNPFDDRVGTDTTLALFYVYNADDDEDLTGPTPGYGSAIPAFGITILEASHVNGGLPSDVGAHPGKHATSSVSYVGAGGVTGAPRHYQDHYYFMQGVWKGGYPITLGGSGFSYSRIPMPFWMPGDPVTGSFWSEVNDDENGTALAEADRRGLISFFGFNLAPGEWTQFTFAFVWARGSDNLNSITELRRATRFIHQNKAAVLVPRTSTSPRIEDQLPTQDPQFPFWVDEPYPNPAQDHVTISMSLKWEAPVTITLIDTLGREWKREQYAGSPGPVTKRLDTRDLPPGTYLIRVSQRSEHVDWPLIVL